MSVAITRRPPLAPLVAVACAVAIALGTQLVAVLPAAGPVGLDEPLLDGAAQAKAAAADGAAAANGPATDLARVRADVGFWAARVAADPANIVAAVQLAGSDMAEARMTGDVTAYLRAQAAVQGALNVEPTYAPARALLGTVLVSLHRFPEARDLARSILSTTPDDPTALGVLGDASLELGDLATAAAAYGELGVVSDGSTARVRAGRLAFVTGDPATAVSADQGAVSAANDEGLTGDQLAFYDVTLGETLLASGDESGARAAYAAALVVRPELPAALVGLAKVDAFDGDLDPAISELDTAIAAIPLPDSLARRADLETLRAGPGDAARAANDLATVEVIAKLAGDAAYVYDRGLSLYLSDHGLDPARAVSLASNELAVRPDIYGYDALAWALLNAGRAAEADAPMRAALAAGTKDARLWYHAGLIAAANGRAAEARTDLGAALALGPALDLPARARAAAALGRLP